MKPLLFALTFASIVPLAALAQAPAAPTAPATEAKVQQIKPVTPDEAEKLTASRKDIIVLDVRTPEEFEDGHIAGAKNLSFIEPDFEERLKEYEGKPVVVHCAAGNRSTKAVHIMKKHNFPELYHLEAGIKGWKEAGKELVKSPKPKE